MELKILDPLGDSDLLVAGRAASVRIKRSEEDQPFWPETDDRGLCFVEDGEIVSLLVWRVYEDYAWVGQVWTHEQYRRRGLYRTMFKTLQEICQKEGLNMISCGVNSDNHVSRATHESFGMTLSMVYKDTDVEVVRYDLPVLRIPFSELQLRVAQYTTLLATGIVTLAHRV